MAFNVTTDLVTINNCDDTTDWSASGGAGLTADTDFKKQGTASISIKVSNSTKYVEYNPTGSWNLSNVHLYWWLNISTIAVLDTIANGGGKIRLTDTSGNWSEWNFVGKDTYGGGWKRFVLDVTKTPTATSGTLDLTLVDKITWWFTTTGSSVNNNIWIDIIHYLSSGNYALKGDQGTSSVPGTWADILTTDENNGYGIVREDSEVIFALGRIQFGDSSGTNDTYFKDSLRTIVFENPIYYNGTSNVAMISDNYYKFNIVGSSTKVTNIQFGDGDDTFGYGGGAIQSAGPRWDWDSETDKADIDSVQMFGVTFRKAGLMQMDEGSGLVQKFITCIWYDCNEVQPNACRVWHSSVMKSTDTTGAMEMLAVHDFKDVDFYNNSRGVHHPTSITVTYDAMNFTGNTYDITHSAAGTLTVNCVNGSNPSTVEETGGGSTSIVNSVYLTVNVEDEDGVAIQSAAVAIYKTSDNSELMNQLTDVNGQAQTTYNYTADTDIYVRVRKSSPPSARFVPYRTSGTITSGGYTLTAVLIADLVAA